MTRWIVAATVVLVLAGEARAALRTSWTDGNDLHKWCSDQASVHQAACIIYSTAIADVMVTGPVSGWRACFPEAGTQRQQFGDIVSRWLERHPEKRHLSAEGLVAQALSEAFPCE